MACQLRVYAFHAAEGCNRHQFSFLHGQVVSGKDVAEQVRLQVIIGGGSERVGELAEQFALNVGSSL